MSSLGIDIVATVAFAFAVGCLIYLFRRIASKSR